MKKLYKKILIAAFALCNIYSCDYLNVSDELAGNLRSLDEISIMYLIPEDGMQTYLLLFQIIQELPQLLEVSQDLKILGQVCVMN